MTLTALSMIGARTKVALTGMRSGNLAQIDCLKLLFLTQDFLNMEFTL